MKWIYFVSYHFTTFSSNGHGRCQITRDSPISTWEDIECLEATVKRYSWNTGERFNHLVVTNYILLSAPPSPDSYREALEKSKRVIKRIDEAWRNCHEQPNVPEEEREDCGRCGGMLYINAGGDTVDCPVCEGSGVEPVESVVNAQRFAEEMENIMYHTSPDFTDLLQDEPEAARTALGEKEVGG